MSRPTSRSRVIGLIALLAGSALTRCTDVHEPASVPDGADENGAAENGAAENPEPANAMPSAAPVAIDSAQPTYEVPVAAELTDYAHYQVDGVQWREKNGERRLAYDLPADLIGHAQRVEFSGPASGTSTWSLQSQKFGDAECEQISDQIACHETLNGIRVDVAAVAARVNAGELDPRQLDVTRIFESDPIGVLRFTAP